MTLLEDRLRQPPTDADIVERVVTAVMEQKLGAGAKLPEAALCDAFHCSRTQIRRVLVVLAERGVATLHPNRGAFVASPDADEARDVFEARRAVERSIVLAATKRIGAAALADLGDNARLGGAAEAGGYEARRSASQGSFISASRRPPATRCWRNSSRSLSRARPSSSAFTGRAPRAPVSRTTIPRWSRPSKWARANARRR